MQVLSAFDEKVLPFCGVTTNVGDAFAVTVSPAITAYADFMPLTIRMNTPNTGAATINVNGLGAKGLKKDDGSDFASLDLKAGCIYSFRYKAQTGNFLCQSKGGVAGLVQDFGDGSDGAYSSTPGIDCQTLLMHCNGANLSTTMTDDVGNTSAITAYGGAKISTTLSKFGGASLNMAVAVTDYVQIDNCDGRYDLGNQDFTIDFWAYVTALPASANAWKLLIGARNPEAVPTIYNWHIAILYATATTATIRFAYSTDGVTNTGNVNSTATITANSWNHICVVRSAGTIKIYVGGVGNTGVSVPTIAGGAPFLRIFKYDTSNSMYSSSGNIDELRIQIGRAAWTANFTPPTAAYTHDPANGNLLFASTAEGDVVVKQFTDMTINAGHLVTTQTRCKGLIIKCTGNLTINGELSMSKKAPCIADVDYVGIKSDLSVLRGQNAFAFLLNGLGGSGGVGGNSRTTSSDMNLRSGGKGGLPQYFGGGYGGGGAGGTGYYNPNYGYGSAGGNAPLKGVASSMTVNPARSATAATVNGVAGTNGQGGSGGVTSSSGTGVGGQGGTCLGAGGGGGGGFAGSGSTPAAAAGPGKTGEGAGGQLILIVQGNITINTGGIISADGGNGGAGGNGRTLSDPTYQGAGGGGGGGGAGGGVVIVLYKGTLTNSGTIRANGGTGGAAGLRDVNGLGYQYDGTAGAAGTVGYIMTDSLAS